MNLTFIRHTSLDIAEGICYGQSDVKVSKNFTNEAEIIKKTIDSQTFDAVFMSPLSRCVDLATYCGYANATPDNRLLELNFGDWEMKPWDEIDDPDLENWYADWVNIQPTNGESFKDQYQRLAHFIEEIKDESYKEVVIFCHAGILHCARVFAGLKTFKETFKEPFDYGAILTISV